jgi:hypothetical protein
LCNHPLRRSKCGLSAATPFLAHRPPHLRLRRMPPCRFASESAASRRQDPQRSGTRGGGWGVGKLGSGGLDQDGEEADGPGGLILGKGDEARFCQVDPLVVQTITGRLSLAKPVRWNPCVRASPGATHIVCDRSPGFLPIGVLAIRGLGGDSAGFCRGLLVSPHPLADVPAAARWTLWHLGSA